MPELLADLEQQRAAVLRRISELEVFALGRLPEPGAAAVIRVAIVTGPTIRVIACIHTASSMSKIATALPACAACRPSWATRLPSITDGNR
jgi:hypothetical protein